MKTKVHIDDEIVEKIKALSRSQGTTFRASLNELLRAGFAASSSQARKVAPYRLPTRPMGHARIDLTKALSVADDMGTDGELFKRLH